VIERMIAQKASRCLFVVVLPTTLPKFCCDLALRTSQGVSG